MTGDYFYHIHWHEAPSRGVAQLPTAIISPTFDAAAVLHSTGMIDTGSDHTHTIAKAYHIYRCATSNTSTVTQLTKTVPTPTLDPATARQGTGVVVAHSDGVHTAAQTSHIHWCHIICKRAVA
jgi:hypothetical protein